MFELFLELVVLLFGVPVPFVNLLELETGILGQLFQLGLGWIAMGILIDPLELVDLISALAGALEADESRSILRCLLGDDFLLGLVVFLVLVHALAHALL